MVYLMNLTIKINRHFWDRVYILYYLLIGVGMFVLMKPNVEIAQWIRIAFLGLVLAPVCFKIESLPFAILCFYGISSSSFVAVLPTSPIYYTIAVFGFYVVYRKKSKDLVYALFFYSYFALCCVVYRDMQEYLQWWIIAVILIDFVKNKTDVENLVYAFLIVSIFLSLLYLVHRDSFAEAYTYFGETEEGLERSSWINGNLFGAVIAAGGTLAVAYLTETLQMTKKRTLFIISGITAALSLVALILNASRGAFFAFTIPAAIMLFMSKIKAIYKVLLFAITIYGIFWLYTTTDVFDLLISRIEEESFDTGGDRTSIWKEKLESFLWDSNYWHYVFGMGRKSCSELRNQMSTHNDFLTAFIGYGGMGLVLFVVIVFLPVIKAKKGMRLPVFILLLYFIIECSVLEPVFRGYLVIIMYYFFVLKYALLFDVVQETDSKSKPKRRRLLFSIRKQL